jgi:hypothetical protein
VLDPGEPARIDPPAAADDRRKVVGKIVPGAAPVVKKRARPESCPSSPDSAAIGEREECHGSREPLVRGVKNLRRVAGSDADHDERGSGSPRHFLNGRGQGAQAKIGARDHAPRAPASAAATCSGVGRHFRRLPRTHQDQPRWCRATGGKGVAPEPLASRRNRPRPERDTAPPSPYGAFFSDVPPTEISASCAARMYRPHEFDLCEVMGDE